jgi:hypothetical protein
MEYWSVESLIYSDAFGQLVGVLTTVGTEHQHLVSHRAWAHLILFVR